MSLSKLWPFQEATRLAKRMDKKQKTIPLMETGFGPSGLPHIGTFAEVARTTYVAKAYKELTGIQPKILVFSDDKDALRAVPTNVPEQDMLSQYIGHSLTNVPDPYHQYSSFGEHNNAMLCRFLDECGFEYEFASSTDYYRSGKFDDALTLMAQNHQKIVDVVAPTLGEERRASWSPFMPLHPATRQVMMVPVTVNADGTMVSWDMPEYAQADDLIIGRVHNPVTGGHCKIQWKADWALRWYALDVDYEMCGKDLRDSVTLSSKICRILGGEPPVNMIYELFLDEDGAKFSKKKGNGVSVDEWSRYAPLASLEHAIFKNPERAKKIFVSAIPQAMEELVRNAEKKNDREDPAFFVTDRMPESLHNLPVSVSLLLNIVDAGNIKDADTLVRMMSRTYSGVELDAITEIAPRIINYYIDIMSVNKNVRVPTEKELVALKDLFDTISSMPSNESGEAYQTEIFEVGKRHYEKSELRQWFKVIYETIFGYESGPRLGQFIELYGKDEFIELMKGTHTLKIG